MKRQRHEVVCQRCGRTNAGTKVCKFCGFDMFEQQVEDAGFLNAVIREMQIYDEGIRKESQRNQLQGNE